MDLPKLGTAACIVVAWIASACDEGDRRSDTALPEYPEDHLIDETDSSPRVSGDPTPQAGTGGLIPGYDPAEITEQDILEALTDDTFSTFDTSGDGELEGVEFKELNRATFEKWRAGAGDQVSEDEFSAALFADWDRNSDDRLSKEEYRGGGQAWVDRIRLKGAEHE